MWGLHHSGGRPLVEEKRHRDRLVDAGDLTDLPNEREKFKHHLRVRYSEKSELVGSQMPLGNFSVFGT